MPEDTTRRTAVVTGGAGGLGRSIAERLTADGYAVCIADADAASGAATALALAAGGEAHFLACDVRDPEEVARVMDAAAARLGGIDLLVCCAHEGCERPVEEITVADWDRTIGTDLTGGFLAAQAAVPHLARSERACIIHVSSIHARIGSGVHAAYAAAMAGLSALDRCLAAELAPLGIRCCTVSPYTVLTDSTRPRLTEPGWEALQRSTVLNDAIMRPEDLADVVRLVASDEGRVLNACDLAVDGGMSIFREKPAVSAYA
ncbi:SDR family NAD(P)-dependent oxidoreductase [Propionicicella superfundia]|uniref:SDR family NAD(P)-dependent oxidoreductase n=1 Tax=Propionicicella superfundia TaxID=348582 RepID=UPI0004295BD5|nr:SDR family oxidoreductase [Propionicicella superfundia]